MALRFTNATIATLAGPERPRVGSEMRELGLQRNASLFVKRGWIREPLDKAVEIDVQGRLITPGLVDAHTHLIFGGNRAQEFEQRCSGATYEEIAASGGGIRSTMFSTRDASLEQLVEIGKKHAGWMLANGTTTAESKTGYGLSESSELDLLRAMPQVSAATGLRIVPTLLALHAVPPERSHADYVSHVLNELLPQAANLCEFVDAFIETNYFTAEDAENLAAAAAGLGLRLHVDQLTNNGGAALAARLGAITADHLEQTDQLGIEALANSKTMLVLLPASVHALGKSKYPEARAMIEAGLPVVLATDFNPGSSPTPSLPYVMHLSCIHMGMTPAEALVACTINAAYSLNRGDRAGSLEPGKAADFVIWNTDDPRDLAYWVGVPLVAEVWIQGQCVAKGPQLLGNMGEYPS